VQIIAAVADGPHSPFRLAPVELAVPRPDEVLVEIRGTGLCHTDLAARDGIYGLPYPVVVGHEGSGIVTAVGGDVEHLAPGDTVAISFSSCGACVPCGRGRPAYCASFTAQNYIGSRPDGSPTLTENGRTVHAHFFGQSSFATHVLANGNNTVKVATQLDISLVGPLGCGIQTGAGAVMRSMACEVGSALLILGAGPVGLAAVMGAAIVKCAQIVVVEPLAARRETALALGATDAIDPGEGRLADAILGCIPGGPNYVFDTTGIVEVINGAIDTVAQNAVLGLVGVPTDFSVNLPINIVAAMQKGLTVRGIVEGDSDPAQFIPELLQHHAQGQFPFDSLITTYPLSDINNAVAAQERGDVVKLVLIPDISG
jgi:aryl-alcohol dehydrogenase